MQPPTSLISPMNYTSTTFGTPALFIIEVSGVDITKGFVAGKVQLIPFAPKVGDVYSIEGINASASMPVEYISYDLTAEQYRIELASSDSDWYHCDAEFLPEIASELTAQGWTVTHHNPA